MAAVRHLGYIVHMRGTTHKAAMVVRRSPENFVQIGRVIFEIWRIFLFEVLVGMSLFTPEF